MKQEINFIETENLNLYKNLVSIYDKERLSNQIREMVANKINTTDFSQMPATTGFSGVKSYFAATGIIIIAGMLVYFFMDNLSKESITQADKVESNLTISDIEQKNNLQILNEENKFTDNIHQKSSAGEVKVKKVETDENLSIETKEYVHTQTINLSQIYSNDEISKIIKDIFSELNLKYNSKSVNDEIIFESNLSKGVLQAENLFVDFRITIKYNSSKGNKLTALLSYYEVPKQLTQAIDINDLFYNKLNSEFLNRF